MSMGTSKEYADGSLYTGSEPMNGSFVNGDMNFEWIGSTEFKDRPRDGISSPSATILVS